MMREANINRDRRMLIPLPFEERARGRLSPPLPSSLFALCCIDPSGDAGSGDPPFADNNAENRTNACQSKTDNEFRQSGS